LLKTNLEALGAEVKRAPAFLLEFFWQSPRFSDQGKAAGPMNKILLAVDDSPASWKAANYVADLARREKDLGIHIFHAIDPLPTELQEFRGAVVISIARPLSLVAMLSPGWKDCLRAIWVKRLSRRQRKFAFQS
jgi:Universal stress protein family